MCGISSYFYDVSNYICTETRREMGRGEKPGRDKDMEGCLEGGKEGEERQTDKERELRKLIRC